METPARTIPVVIGPRHGRVVWLAPRGRQRPIPPARPALPPCQAQLALIESLQDKLWADGELSIEARLTLRELDREVTRFGDHACSGAACQWRGPSWLTEGAAA